jgi:hypothetical protein
MQGNNFLDLWDRTGKAYVFMCLGLYSSHQILLTPHIRWKLPFLGALVAVTVVLMLVVVTGIWASIKRAKSRRNTILGWLAFIAFSIVFILGIHTVNN